MEKDEYIELIEKTARTRMVFFRTDKWIDVEVISCDSSATVEVRFLSDNPDVFVGKTYPTPKGALSDQKRRLYRDVISHVKGQGGDMDLLQEAFQ